MFDVYRIDRLAAEDVEYLGTKRKFWFRRNGERCLFKAEERGTGEDWAEKIACELASRLGLPHVTYELAEEYEVAERGQPGVICANFAPPPLALIMGNQLLFDRNPQYPRQIERNYGRREHTVDAVTDVLATLHIPDARWMTGCPVGITTALGVFVGYALLDAWIANQDRHHENWGSLQYPDGTRRLAPSYDHGASLARNISDEERKERLETRDIGRSVPHFAKRARSGFYAAGAGQTQTLLGIDAFHAFGERDRVAKRIWMDKLASVTSDEVEYIVNRIPSQRMSPVTQRFTLTLLAHNQRRLLEGRS